MALRSEREKSKMQEKYQVILSQMLREEDNKYCVDCDTKSPRWASWNIGVFICIRCAGFHRNLGVHISKVKSVNLDSWTGAQIASMQAMGNSRARAVYEANLPDGFRRPQSDSALESFIRAKYEQRKWIAKEWIPPEITVPIDLIESETNQRRVEPKSDTDRSIKSPPKLKPLSMPVSTCNSVRQAEKPASSTATTPSLENNIQDLLNLDEPSSPVINNTTGLTNKPSSTILDPLHEIFATSTVTTSSSEHDVDVMSMAKELENAFSSSHGTSLNTNGMMSNEKIMALFNKPQVSTVAPTGMNMRPQQTSPTNIAFPGFNYVPAPHSNIVPPQKSMSFSNNLYQQATNFAYQSQQNYPHQGINHRNPTTAQSPTTTLTHVQLNNQFLQFANTRSNTSAATLISNMPTRPVTEYMPASTDTRWQ